MAATYDYNSNKVNSDSLTNEMVGTDLPEPTIIIWNQSETPYNLHITFESALDSGQQATLAVVVSEHTGDPWQYPPDELDYYYKNDPIATDPRTEISGPFNTIQNLVNRRELFNDTDNPLYLDDFTPILGENGWAEDHADRINNLETIHNKLGWHNQQVLQSLYDRPEDLLIYYGWLNSFNSAQHGWDNEKVAQEMSQYGLIILGNGIQDPTHADYANTQIIIPRIKALNPNTLIFGYVTVNQTLANFQTKTDQWNTLQVHGIFMDESGYDYGKTRSEFNDRVDYVHGRTYSNKCFANAWNTDHILGTANDPSYPNSTYNSSLAESNLSINDWILLESFPINTTAYSGSQGYESKTDWAARGSKAIGLRATYGVNFAGVGIINNDNASGANLFNFGFISSMMWSLEGWGTSDTSYGSSSAAVKWWTRPDITKMGPVWTLNATIRVDSGDADIYHRYVKRAKMSLDFSSSAQASSITKW